MNEQDMLDKALRHLQGCSPEVRAFVSFPAWGPVQETVYKGQCQHEAESSMHHMRPLPVHPYPAGATAFDELLNRTAISNFGELMEQEAIEPLERLLVRVRIEISTEPGPSLARLIGRIASQGLTHDREEREGEAGDGGDGSTAVPVSSKKGWYNADKARRLIAEAQAKAAKAKAEQEALVEKRRKQIARLRHRCTSKKVAMVMLWLESEAQKP